MKLGYTIFYVDDVRSHLSFYERAFGLKTRFLHDSGDYGELDTGTTALAFCSRTLMVELGKSPGRPEAGKPVFEIALVTADVPAAVEQALSAGALLIQAPAEMPWGQTVAYVADPEGFLVEICTPVA